MKGACVALSIEVSRAVQGIWSSGCVPANSLLCKSSHRSPSGRVEPPVTQLVSRLQMNNWEWLRGVELLLRLLQLPLSHGLASAESSVYSHWVDEVLRDFYGVKPVNKYFESYWYIQPYFAFTSCQTAECLTTSLTFDLYWFKSQMFGFVEVVLIMAEG